jgi:membrane-bound ClpP family serine protease
MFYMVHQLVHLLAHLFTRATDPNLALLALVLGVIGIYTEFCGPGLIVPGVLGSVLALFGLASLTTFPISRPGVALIVLAPALYLLGAMFGMRASLTAAGTLAMALGALMLIDLPGPHIRLAMAVLMVPFGLLTSFLISVAVCARRNKTAYGNKTSVGEGEVILKI